MWDIIIWCKENAIDYVPSIWANKDNTFYKFPTGFSQKRIREIIYEGKDIEENYTWCKVVLKKKNIPSLERAKRLCNDGQYTSNLETDEEDDIIEKRKRKKAKRLIEEDDDYDNSVIDKTIKKTFNIPLLSTENINTHNLNRRTNIELGNDASSSNLSDEPDTHSLPIESSSASSLTHISISDSKDSLNKILRLQMEIKFELKDIRNKIEKFENQRLLEDHFETSDPSIFVDLPCQNLEKIKEVDRKILQEHHFNSLVNMLYNIGGDTIQRTIYCMMRKLLSNDVAMLYSGQGKKHKLPFCNLKIYKAITIAVMKRHRVATDELIKKVVSAYLAQSKARTRGRSSGGATQNDEETE